MKSVVVANWRKKQVEVGAVVVLVVVVVSSKGTILFLFFPLLLGFVQPDIEHTRVLNRKC